MHPIYVEDGIFIDLKCSSIKNITEGVFIPTGKRGATIDSEFEKALSEFLHKWFPPAVYFSTNSKE